MTLELLDDILDQAAAFSPFSSIELKEKVQEKSVQSKSLGELLSTLFRGLRSTEAKWVIRMLWKNYGPVKIPETVTMKTFHFLLPDLLRFQNSLSLLPSDY